MVNISSIEREPIKHRTFTNPFQPGDVVQWTPSTRGRDIPETTVLAVVLKAMVGIDSDDPKLVRCHIEYWGERFSVGIDDLRLYKRTAIEVAK
jgi:hypothetical protein